MTVEEELAQALWAVPPSYRPTPAWDLASEETQDQYRARARKLLEQFHIYPRYTPEGL